MEESGFNYLGVEDFVGSMPHPAFDNTQAYNSGDVVTYWGQYWQATRAVSPPWFPSIQSGDVPGSSDAWRSMSGDEVTRNVLGVDVRDTVVPWFSEVPAISEVLHKAIMDETPPGMIGQVVTIPTAGGSYTDAKTIAAVQAALNARGASLVVDGMYGAKTKAAIKKFENDLNMDPAGIIDYNLVTVLRVTPGTLPPGVTIQDAAALQAQVALDAATAAEHAETPSDVQAAAAATMQAGDAASPPLPPEIRQAAMDALKRAKAAKTPADVKAAAEAVQAAAKNVHAAVKPSWLVEPAWPGGWARWKVGAAGVGGTAVIGTALALILR